MAAGISLMLAIVVLVIAIFWIALPFLVNATNTRLDKLIEETRELRRAVQGLTQETPK